MAEKSHITSNQRIIAVIDCDKNRGSGLFRLYMERKIYVKQESFDRYFSVYMLKILSTNTQAFIEKDVHQLFLCGLLNKLSSTVTENHNILSIFNGFT